MWPQSEQSRWARDTTVVRASLGICAPPHATSVNTSAAKAARRKRRTTRGTVMAASLASAEALVQRAGVAPSGRVDEVRVFDRELLDTVRPRRRVHPIVDDLRLDTVIV